jgi:hypothetical protein
MGSLELLALAAMLGFTDNILVWLSTNSICQQLELTVARSYATLTIAARWVRRQSESILSPSASVYMAVQYITAKNIQYLASKICTQWNTIRKD